MKQPTKINRYGEWKRKELEWGMFLSFWSAIINIDYTRMNWKGSCLGTILPLFYYFQDYLGQDTSSKGFAQYQVFLYLALEFCHPQSELNSKVEQSVCLMVGTKVSTYHQTKYSEVPLTIVIIDVHDNRDQRLNLLSEAQAENTTIFQTPGCY